MANLQAKRVSLSDAALRLGISYWKARDMVLRGQLQGGKDGRGRYEVDLKTLERMERERRQGSHPLARDIS